MPPGVPAPSNLSRAQMTSSKSGRPALVGHPPAADVRDAQTRQKRRARVCGPAGRISLAHFLTVRPVRCGLLRFRGLETAARRGELAEGRDAGGLPVCAAAIGCGCPSKGPTCWTLRATLFGIASLRRGLWGRV